MNRATEKGCPIRNVLQQYKNCARVRGNSWELTDAQAVELFQSPCAYCGIEPYRVRVGSGKRTFTFNGIDRVNNDEGYTPSNTVPCCYPCNVGKGKRTPAEFISWARRIAEHCA